ncbi:MAG: acyl-CoA dehydrogenase family protein [Chloroflexi bacterium]|nr:acyl-CoA dehydrogenase family protein [Chloroflexota bacterium]HEV8053431.1 acyl-CoA dehydrogenase family protein [Candidatus Limnocylindrales bacterium]
MTTFDLALTPENLLVRASVRDFAAAEIAPHIREWDEKHEVHREVFARMGELGFLGAPIPEAYGGAGMDYTSLGILCEELERVDTAFRVAMSVHVGLNSLALLQWGTEAQKQRWLVPQARGEKLATFGLTEPGAGTDAASLQTTARRDGDDYVLNGSKLWISLADVADHFLVFATLDRSRGHKGITAFMLERGMSGFSTASIEGKLGIHAGNTGSLFLDDVRVPAEHRLGEEGEGFTIAMSAIDQGRYTVATGAVGLAQACLDASLAYAHERRTFGKEIGRHQLVKQMIARMGAGIEAGRLLCRQAAWLKDRGIRNTRETSLAKWYCTDHAVACALDAIQIHGAYGYSNEYPVERYLRNAKAAVIYEGTSQLHTLIQADYLLGYRQDQPIRCPPLPSPGQERQ